MLDTLGNAVSKESQEIVDASFLRRLRNFDPNLSLVRRREDGKYMILEKAYDGSGYNIILICEDNDGNPKPLGDWVINKLFVFRQRYIQKRDIGVDCWLNELKDQAEDFTEKQLESVHDDKQAEIREDITQWRKAIKGLRGEAESDAIAGYPKGGTKC